MGYSPLWKALAVSQYEKAKEQQEASVVEHEDLCNESWDSFDYDCSSLLSSQLNSERNVLATTSLIDCRNPWADDEVDYEYCDDADDVPLQTLNHETGSSVASFGVPHNPSWSIDDGVWAEDQQGKPESTNGEDFYGMPVERYVNWSTARLFLRV
ncbi:hypothetical protein BO70DRAFT_396389 [Aspergillus heteromorphus CBS 117.55]|uniref:Uncharacterized protein n=1 Tax=Aspergillus heteromorphus CBS 117.55 TaxID=1448321 RepID=A0A317W665_9EURO|nr:uncharacterized protein BO70DRAFT_396389 [Aspergillus heteromorphus CBS 117.55]PWY82096.1 hypothetical protein BO70DRAFT_396389 [Aspergillus heteromorphus CBS 117.55]